MQNVNKTYNHRTDVVKALSGASLNIQRGEFVAVVGPSGSGKSTLLLVLGGMLSPTEGKVLFGERSLYDLTPDDRAAVRRKEIGFVFQTFNLVPYLTALENVQMPLFLADHSEAQQKSKATALLERVGLADRLGHKPAELSVGQQQRVALARVMANDPAVILADEPTGNLDPETSGQIVSFLEQINRDGKTVVMVTHDPRSALRAKRTLKLVDGRILPDGQTEET